MSPRRLSYPTAIFFAVVYSLAVGGVYYIATHGLTAAELGLVLASYFLGCLGITSLYHRSWTHHAVVFNRPLEYLLSILAVLVVQGPGLIWVNDHIQHHQYTDDDGDPHSILKGFWWAHHHWFIFPSNPPIRLPARLQTNPVLYWQNRWYWPLSAALNLVLPVAVSIASGSPWWAGVLTSMLRITVCNHIIWCVNSVCHTYGTQPFTKRVSARDVWWFPFTLGEQYHNYHHAFPRDYRNGIKAYDFDPTKWFIWTAHKLRLAQAPFKMAPERIAAARQSVL